MENDRLTPPEIAERYDLELEAVLEAIDYVRANEAFLAAERMRMREQAIADGYLTRKNE